ncbi:Holliday junction DNA helicase RuvA [Gloeomargarita lithophora Alchichica-D10]|uniref:Holliday junction branch migration complex subunit RuvA n=1 Tax=Gloeomargarita lithophora Alchichica-D10 TaxID=1188229 RepID=A0A1J0A9W2_9CYAN|nr:Holliday junction branch migration protein RuvA [Gloeomargarita lithophora]APB32718.1 Holliday junction DNA helicase RuvA [Gloeomargarita lithophora Alchichica-D10]
MIGSLTGQVAGLNPVQGKWVVTLVVQGVGWELQVGQRCRQGLTSGDTAQLFSHLQIREEQPVLYGFGTAQERDLFRQLIRVNGVGPQLALALLDTLAPLDLVQAIVTGNTALLSQTPGVGQKTAQRLSLELRQPLQQWQGVIPAETLPSSMQEEVTLTLGALGYTSTEISHALGQLAQDQQCQQTTDAEVWIRRAIRVLS